jgi:exopolysaccharide biosynthesis protein
MDANLEPHLKNLAQKEMQSLAPPKIAISGFRGILSDRQILVSPSDVLHPRTSIGFNATLKQLVLVVVDGRQKKISEGVSEEELARLMLEFGCSDAINLDGGGSSVMIVRENDGDLRYINRSSDVTGVRPVPVIFGFRAR